VSDESSLLAAAQRGDARARDALLIRHLPGLEAYLRLQMGPALRAKLSVSDLAQSVCIEILQQLEGFEYRGEAAFRQWLYGHARHKVLEKHRLLTRQRRDIGREVPYDDARGATLLAAYATLCTPSRELAMREAVASVEAAFDALPEDYREAISLHRMVGLSHAEIALQMNRSEGAVRNLVYRGLSKLAIALAGRAPDATE
jgi:RNA polymerase sigma-70 factor (ECF subfamily)